MPSIFVDGVEYQYETSRAYSGFNVDVYNVATQEHVVGVFFDHDTETAEVEGPEFQESAPYFELCNYTDDDIARWAVAQIPEY